MAEYEFRVMQKSLRKRPSSQNKVYCELTCQCDPHPSSPVFLFIVKDTQCQLLD